MNNKTHVSLAEAMASVNVTKATLLKYLKHLSITTVKQPFDKRHFITSQDYNMLVGFITNLRNRKSN